MGIPDHQTCLLRNLYVDQEAIVRTGHGTKDCFQIGKGVCRVAYCHPAYLTYMQSTACEMLGWIKHKLESRMLGEINNLRYADDTTLMAKSEEAGLKLSIQETKIQSHQFMTNGEKMETVADFIFLGFKITADSDCSPEIKRRLLLGRKAMTNLVSILKSRDITLPTNVYIVKPMIFAGVMHGCESCIIKKAEH